jgi:hypothetical protein
MLQETDDIKTEGQIKSLERVAEHGEVYTAEREVNAMLDLVKNETERIDSRFLEPACGTGNFLVEVLKRKLAVVENKYKKSQIEWERNALIAVASLYGVDILEDNTKECQNRLYTIFSKYYVKTFGTNCKMDYLKSIKFILKRNILWGNALDFKNPLTKKPIVFSEWSLVDGNKIKRRDYIFKFLVEKTHQFKLELNDEGQPPVIDEPIKDFPLIDILKIHESD